jgi:hypothetical protein
MDTISLLPIFALGVFGGILPEALRLYKLRESASFPDYLKGPKYWIITVLMILIGGVLALVYQMSGMSLNPILAINIGASAPLAITVLSSTVVNPPQINPNPGATTRGATKSPGKAKTTARSEPSVLNFLSGR